MAVEIIRIQPSQWRELRELRLASLADSPDAFGQRLEEATRQPDDEWRAIARAAAEGDRRVWLIAWDGDRPIGLVQGRRRPPSDCLLFSMWIAPAARRGGHGRSLVDAVERWGAAWGAERVVLWVIAGNAGAIEFYRRIGFSVIESGPDAESGAAYGALAMERAISGR
jgi:ribosomal protein S18 acetylase RimI-like enzyme